MKNEFLESLMSSETPYRDIGKHEFPNLLTVLDGGFNRELFTEMICKNLPVRKNIDFKLIEEGDVVSVIGESNGVGSNRLILSVDISNGTVSLNVETLSVSNLNEHHSPEYVSILKDTDQDLNYMQYWSDGIDSPNPHVNTVVPTRNMLMVAKSLCKIADSLSGFLLHCFCPETIHHRFRGYFILWNSNIPSDAVDSSCLLNHCALGGVTSIGNVAKSVTFVNDKVHVVIGERDSDENDYSCVMSFNVNEPNLVYLKGLSFKGDKGSYIGTHLGSGSSSGYKLPNHALLNVIYNALNIHGLTKSMRLVVSTARALLPSRSDNTYIVCDYLVNELHCDVSLFKRNEGTSDFKLNSAWKFIGQFTDVSILHSMSLRDGNNYMVSEVKTSISPVLSDDGKDIDCIEVVVSLSYLPSSAEQVVLKGTLSFDVSTVDKLNKLLNEQVLFISTLSNSNPSKDEFSQMVIESFGNLVN